jgi:prolyl oligopeptidase
LTVSGFLQPTSLYMGNLDGGEADAAETGAAGFLTRQATK